MSHTILLVEDDFEMRRLLSRALRRDDYTIVEASNGYELASHADDVDEATLSARAARA